MISDSAAPHWFEQADVPALHRALAKRLEHEIRGALAARGQAFLALAGGSTPLPAYHLLSQASLDWERVTIVPTDERWVPAQHPACNLRQLQQCFSNHAEIQWLSLTPEHITERLPTSAHHANKNLASMPMAFDVVLLGMGLDAHTASLFPSSDGLETALDPQGLASAVAITPKHLPPEAPFARVSLTLSRLLHAHTVMLAITSAAKRGVLEQALQEAPAAMPIARVVQAAGNGVEIYWSP